MFLKLASAESVFGISGIIRYRPNLPWSVLVRERVCVRVRVRFPLSVQSVLLPTPKQIPLIV